MITTIFLIVSIIIFNGVALVIPKKLTKIEIYGSTIFVLLLQLMTDVIFALKYNFYGYFNEGIELITFLTFFVIYPPFSLIMLNYFPFHKSLKRKALYVTGVTIFCLFYEYLTVKFMYFYHDEWTYLYSALSYPIFIMIMVYNLTLIRKIAHKYW
jgi:hypothetical protein